MKRLLADARARCESLMSLLLSAQRALKDQANEIAIPLHQRVEDYVRALRQQLMECEAARIDAEVCVCMYVCARVCGFAFCVGFGSLSRVFWSLFTRV